MLSNIEQELYLQKLKEQEQELSFLVEEALNILVKRKQELDKCREQIKQLT